MNFLKLVKIFDKPNHLNIIILSYEIFFYNASIVMPLSITKKIFLQYEIYLFNPYIGTLF